MAMFDQMPNALLRALSILHQHRIRSQAGDRPVQGDNRNTAVLKQLFSRLPSLPDGTMISPATAMFLKGFKLGVL